MAAARARKVPTIPAKGNNPAALPWYGLSVAMTTTLGTDSGMHVLWDRKHFAKIVDFPTWESQLLEDADLVRLVGLGHLVPINIHGDGAFTFAVRTDPAGTPVLTEPEAARVLASSQAYLFDCAGYVDLSGIEHVCGEPDPRQIASMTLPPGVYEVSVHLLDRDDVPTGTDEQPDFVVLIGQQTSGAYSDSLLTFGH